jgi:Domain of unknown function (DUF4136)
MRLLLLLSFSLMLGCQYSNVSVDYDTQASFSNYQYYSLKEPAPENPKDAPIEKKEVSDKQQAEPAPKPAPQRDTLINKRVKKAVVAQLSRSGIQPASASNPADVLIRHTVISQVHTEPPNSGASIGLGRSGGKVGVGVGFRIPLGRETVKKDVTIYVDLLDAKDEVLKWRGSKTLVFGNESPDKISTSIDAAVAEIFSFYPPSPGQQ